MVVPFRFFNNLFRLYKLAKPKKKKSPLRSYILGMSQNREKESDHRACPDAGSHTRLCMAETSQHFAAVLVRILDTLGHYSGSICKETGGHRCDGQEKEECSE